MESNEKIEPKPKENYDDEGVDGLEFIGAFRLEDAEIISKHFHKENIGFSFREDQSVHHGNSPFTTSPGGSTDDVIEKIFVEQRDVKRAVAICEELFGTQQ